MVRITLACVAIAALTALACGAEDAPSPAGRPAEQGAGLEAAASEQPRATEASPALEGKVRLPLPALDAVRSELKAARSALARAESGLARTRASLEAAERHLGALEGGAVVASDIDLFRAVQRRLLEAPALQRVAIAAEVDQATVTLRGFVPDAQTARAAEQIVSAVPGVAGVENRIEIAP